VSSVSFMSWNLALMARPHDAPAHWELHDTEAFVRQSILDRSPAIVVLQELPGLVPFVETHAMVGANPRTHSGNLATLVDHEFMEPEPTWATVGSFCLLIQLGQLTLANVHLASGPGAADERLEQLSSIRAAAPTEALLVVGDTNTRIGEEAAIAKLGLGGERPPVPTWDSKKNTFRADSAEFSAYFSRWFSSANVHVDTPWVDDSSPLEAGSGQFFVSDHFACGATASVRAATA